MLYTDRWWIEFAACCSWWTCNLILCKGCFIDDGNLKKRKIIVVYRSNWLNSAKMYFPALHSLHQTFFHSLCRWICRRMFSVHFASFLPYFNLWHGLDLAWLEFSAPYLSQFTYDSLINIGRKHRLFIYYRWECKITSLFCRCNQTDNSTLLLWHLICVKFHSSAFHRFVQFELYSVHRIVCSWYDFAPKISTSSKCKLFIVVQKF